MVNIGILLSASFLILINQSTVNAASYLYPLETEEKPLIARMHPFPPREAKTVDISEDFNKAYGDGFGDYVLSKSCSKGVNILRMKQSLRPLTMTSDFFTNYCIKTYKISAEMSERMRQTLLREMGLIDEVSPPVILLEDAKGLDQRIISHRHIKDAAAIQVK